MNMGKPVAVAPDADSLNQLINAAVHATDTGGCPTLEGLAAAEAYGRAGLLTGRPDLTRKLAAVLLCRAGYERANGNADFGDRMEAEALVLIMLAAQGQDLQATAALRAAGVQLTDDLIAEANASAPQSWVTMPPAGNC